MDIKQTDSVPCWVRTGFCITACFAVLGLIYVASTGTDINIGVSAVVGVFALNTSGYVFHGRSNTELILEFLKKNQE